MAFLTPFIFGATVGILTKWQWDRRRQRQEKERFDQRLAEAMVKTGQVQMAQAETEDLHEKLAAVEAELFTQQAYQAEQQHLQEQMAATEAQLNQIHALREAKQIHPVDVSQLDELAEIDGIGPLFARRLKDAGILTFADLARQTPAQICAIIQSDNPVDEIEVNRWIGQAQVLAAK